MLPLIKPFPSDFLAFQYHGKEVNSTPLDLHSLSSASDLLSKSLSTLSVHDVPELKDSGSGPLTFPDNYYFENSQGWQFQQVGNAVPPFLASQIAEYVITILKDKNLI